MRKESIVGIQGSNGFVGCGFAITPRHILTCAHVVNAASNSVKGSAQAFPVGLVSVSFPYLGNKPVKARVIYWKPDVHDILQLPSVHQGIEEDIAGLELLENVPEVQPVQVKPYSENVEFKALGYPRKTPQGAVAQGTIRAAIPFGWVQIDGNSPEGFWVAPGYSGTPIWDIQQTGRDVYGMMVAVRKEDDMAQRIAYMMPYQKLERAIAFLQLLDILPQPENLEDDLWRLYQSVYEQCKPPDWNPAMPIPETPSEILRQISEMGQAELTVAEKPVERTWEFVARFLSQSHFLLEKQRQDLRDWGVRQFSEFLNLIDAVRQEKPIQLSVEKQVMADPCLLVEVSPNQPPYSTRAFFIPDSKSYDPDNRETWKEIVCWDFQQKRERIEDLEPFSSNIDELKSRLAGYIKTCERRYQPERRFRLELILPLSLMNLPIEGFELESSSYGTVVPGSTFPVVIRAYVRTTKEYREDLGWQWEQKWKRLQDNPEASAHQCLAEVFAKTKVPQMTAAYQNPQTVGFRLLEVLQTPLQEKFLGALLGAAAPVAVWLRHIPNNSHIGATSVQEHLNEFLQCNGSPPCSLDSLLERTLKVRAEAIAAFIEPDDDNFIVGHHLSLLWENPNLLPPLAPKHVSE